MKINFSIIFFVTFAAFLIGLGVIDKQRNDRKNSLKKILLEETQKKEASLEPQVTNTPKEEIKEEPPKPAYINPPPEVNATAFTVINLTAGKTLYKKAADQVLPIASLTKTMTAIVALEEYDLNKGVVVPEKCTKITASRVGFKTNDVLTMEDMLYGLLVKSGADAACSIANVGEEKEFIAKMNEKAKELGLKNTVFSNEIGFDAEESQVSSVEDIEKMTSFALKFSTFRKIVGTKSISLKSLNTPPTIYDIQNTNDLLFTIPGTVGIKTGYTEQAKGCLTYLYENKGQEILIILLGSEDRFGDTKTILEWAGSEISLAKEQKENLGG